MQRRILFVNPNAGSRSPSPDELERAARERGIDVHRLEHGVDPRDLVRRNDATAVGVAGGDGSLAPVAALALERDIPFVCVPLGTRNHFARDLGLDDDAVAALDAFGGKERRIDIGRVGGRLFLNNVAMGAYARLVHRRERHRRRRDAFARLRALAMVARHPHRLQVSVDGRPLAARVLLVANNHYDLRVLSLGSRERLDEGLLHLYAANGLLPQTWEERAAATFTLDAGRPVLAAAVDGEPAELRLPVEIRVEPQALRVLTPEPG